MTAPAQRRRGTLTKAAVLQAALTLLDSDGADALTMRRLADALGVSPMALYRHVRTKEEINEGLADLALESLDIEPDPAAPWPDQLATIFRNIHAALLAHPAMIQILMSQPVTGTMV